ncbi:hybrid sensor histidine kinase/response regulator transcription factor [Mariniflexile ostreae]
MRKSLICLMFLALSVNLHAQNIGFEYFGLKDGLSQISATSLIQDDIGRIWIGTRDGLNVYDGVKVKTFRALKGDTTTLLGHSIKKLVKQGENLWVITYSGLSKLDTKTLVFEQFPFKGVHAISLYKNVLLVATSRGLFELDPINKTLISRHDIYNKNNVVNSLSVDNTGQIWIGSEEGLFMYDGSSKICTKILNVTSNVVFTDSKKRIWVGTDNDGVFLLNRINGVLKHFTSDGSDQSIVSNFVRDINEDSQGNIWVGTFLGLSIINDKMLTVNNYQQSEVDKHALSHNSVYSILRDNQGTMWVGTYFGGISYYNPDFHIFKHYPIRYNHSGGISYRVIGRMVEDSNNNIWIATGGGGVNYFDRQNNLFRHFKRKEGGKGLSSNNVKSLLFVDENTLLIGTHTGGLNIMDIKKEKFTVFKNNPDDSLSIPSDKITSIIAYNDYYLLGTHKGIVKFDYKRKVFSPFIKDKTSRQSIGEVIFDLFTDSDGKLWIGTERNGLFVFDPTIEELIKYVNSDNPKSLGNNTINCIFEDKKQQLWVGTNGGGISKYNPKSNNFTNYTASNFNLPSDFVYGIQESRSENLWVSTSRGLVSFDVENKRLYSYNQNNGFPLNELNYGSLYLSNDGELFVGGVNGLISFKEADLLKKTPYSKLLFTSLYLQNKEVIPRDNTGILNKDLTYTDKIVFNPEHHEFTIYFSSFNFISTNDNRYEYMMENFNDTWVNAGNQTFLTYTNLDPGTYTLKVRSRNNADNKIIDTKSIDIIVNPAFYETWYAYLFYFVFLAALIAWLNQIYLSRVRLEDSLEAERKENEHIKEMNQSKLRFFINVSHEFRTPLTLMTGTLDSILEDIRGSSKNYSKLLAINKNAARLNNLVTELLDFRKIEGGELQLKVGEQKFLIFIDEIFQSFVEYSQHKKVGYELKKPNYPITLWFDAFQMGKVFYNLVSNAFKVVDENSGRITIEVIDQTETVDIVVSDNGPGVPYGKKDKIFDRFYQLGNVSGKTVGYGTGIGLALCKNIIKEHHGEIALDSTVGEGTMFVVRLKKGNNHFNKSEIVQEEADKLQGYDLSMDYKFADIKDDAIEQYDFGYKVLLVEDNHEVRYLLKNIFSKHYNLLEASNGEEGLESAIAHQPDLIISDVMMPNMSGTEMCAKLKRNKKTSHIPVILLTARTAVEYKIEGIETGADDYIIKPFNTKLLKARVRSLLETRSILQKKFSRDPNLEVKDLVNNSIDQKIMEKAQEIVMSHIDNVDFGIDDFAQEMGLGRTRLFTKIKGITGQTPNEFILSIKLKKAVELLTDQPQMNISDIAYAVGFNTLRHFSRCFKNYFGETPSKFMQKLPSNDSGTETF